MPANAAPLIQLRELSKRYRGVDHFSVKGVSLHVKAGEVYGFLGPNGAGKSTTIRMLMNFIQPTEGTATVLGMDSVQDSVAIKRSVGYLASDMPMYPKMSGAQFLAYMAQLQHMSDHSYKDQLLKRLKADGSVRIGSLSRGNRQKFAIVQAFMHKPDILILDEPSSGLDPLMQETFYELLNEARARGAAVFMSSHIMSEVQKVCDRVGIIREGKLIVERNIAEMAKEAAHTFEITFAGKPPVAELKRLSGLEVASHDDKTVIVHLHGDLSKLLALLGRYEVIQLEVRQLDLEELFMHFYKNGDAS